LDELQRGLALFPESNSFLNELASAYIKARQYSKAIEPLKTSLEVQSVQTAAWVYLGMAATGVGKHEEALGHFEKAATIRRTPWVLNHLGYVYAKLGQKDSALRMIAALKQSATARLTYYYEIGTIYAALGDTEAAFASLSNAVDRQEQGLLWLKVDYLVDDLRTDPRFGSYLKKMRLDLN
jgi:tetratricopeptide (TPR) repeat protein